LALAQRLRDEVVAGLPAAPFHLNVPGAIKHVLLNTKSELGRRLLEPGIGRGLLTSEGETWRRHRGIMAPAFDHRSIVGYAPINRRGRNGKYSPTPTKSTRRAR
jgi:cytochrome P450